MILTNLWLSVFLYCFVSFFYFRQNLNFALVAILLGVQNIAKFWCVCLIFHWKIEHTSCKSSFLLFFVTSMSWQSGFFFNVSNNVARGPLDTLTGIVAKICKSLRLNTSFTNDGNLLLNISILPVKMHEKNIYIQKSRFQSFTSLKDLKAVLHQNINGCFGSSRCLIGTFLK